jgi:hypothetical protein
MTDHSHADSTPVAATPRKSAGSPAAVPGLGRSSRRAFLAATAGGLALPTIVRARNLNDEIRLAAIGVGGRGGGNLQELSVKGVRVTAVCDVNADTVERAGSLHPDAARHRDFRKLFDRPGDFDAVAVSNCEHTHFHAVMLALRADKHVYCEKPLSHNVREARLIREEAARRKVATQMGIQIHATENYRRVVDLIQAGVIGPVRKVSAWVGRTWGRQSPEDAKRFGDIVTVLERPGAEPVPASLDWDLWIGPAPMRPFHSVYVPGPKWYRWWDFGNGTMSDLGSHWNDLPFWALKLKAPTSIEAGGPPPHPELAPATMSATYRYGPRGDLPAVTLSWHQGQSKPPEWTDGTIPKWDSGCLFTGDGGMLLADYGRFVLLPEATFKDAKLPERTIPKSPGHHAEWLGAIRGGPPALADFEYSGWLTEANHLGNVAHRVGKRLEWDAANLRCPNAPEADPYLARTYRAGWDRLLS